MIKGLNYYFCLFGPLMLHYSHIGGDLYEELKRNGGRLKKEEVTMLVSTQLCIHTNNTIHVK